MPSYYQVTPPLHEVIPKVRAQYPQFSDYGVTRATRFLSSPTLGVPNVAPPGYVFAELHRASTGERYFVTVLVQ